MKRDFIAELQRISRALDGGVPRIVDENERKPKGRRYNVHKRSLPPGVDKPVLFGLGSRQLAEDVIENATDSKGVRTFGPIVTEKGATYYEAVPADANESERSVYHNPRPFVKEEGSDPEVPDTGMTNDEQGWIG